MYVSSDGLLSHSMYLTSTNFRVVTLTVNRVVDKKSEGVNSKRSRTEGLKNTYNLPRTSLTLAESSRFCRRREGGKHETNGRRRDKLLIICSIHLSLNMKINHKYRPQSPSWQSGTPGRTFLPPTSLSW